MADREYFSLRYAVPGFSLILIIVGLNYSPFLGILTAQGTTEVFGVLLSFLSLFASSAIGFLVAQIWFCYFNNLELNERIYKKFESSMQTRLGWKTESNGKDKRAVMAAALDYMLLRDKDENKWGFCQRKWDIYHILSGSLVSLILGLFVGLIMRAYLEYSFFGNSICESIRSGWTLLTSIGSASAASDGILQAKTDVFVMAFTLIGVLTMILITFLGRRKVFDEYYKVVEIFIKNSNKDGEFRKELSSMFPDHFEAAAKNKPCST